MSITTTIASHTVLLMKAPDLHAWVWLILIFAVTCIRSFTRRPVIDAPLVGHRGRLEPTWLLRLRFIRGSRWILQQGYDQFKYSMFKIQRIGTDVLILPSGRIEELRSLTRDMESSVEPFMNDYAGELTSGNAFLHSDLQNRVLQQKLTPALALFAPIIKEELDLAILEEMPSCKDWVKVDILTIFASIIARVSARIFLGQNGSHNREWLTTTAQYTENLFKTGMLLRMVPRCIRPILAQILPSYRQLCKNRKTAIRIISEIVELRRTAEIELGEKYEGPTDILQWMTDLAEGNEKDLPDLGQRMLILSLSSIHTTAITMAQALYDLVAHPQYVVPIEAEIVKALEQNQGWSKKSLNQFRKLDSLLKESQRFNPIFLVTFNRILSRRVVFEDKHVLEAGTRIAVPSYNMLHDSDRVPGPALPSEFDPFRYARLRENPVHPENAQKYQFAMVDSHNMAFGYGKHACPGRAYASDEIKMVLAHMLLKYEWAFPIGQKRPKNFTVDTDMYPDRSARLMVKMRPILDNTVRQWV